MTSRIDTPQVQAMAAAIRELGDPVRLAVIQLLASGDRSASELADELGIAAPRLANHLTRLRAAGLVTVTRSGRHSLYRIGTPAITRALTALEALVPDAAPAPSAAPPTARAEARSCYDHMAGRLGVAVFDQLVATRALQPPGCTDETDVDLGPAADGGFIALGVDLTTVRPRRRKLARTCLDWTERRPHLGGALGAAILDSALHRGWVVGGEGRILQITAAGRLHLPHPPAVARD